MTESVRRGNTQAAICHGLNKMGVMRVVVLFMACFRAGTAGFLVSVGSANM